MKKKSRIKELARTKGYSLKIISPEDFLNFSLVIHQPLR